MELDLRVYVPDLVPDHLVEQWLTGVLETAGVEVIEIQEA